LSCRGDSESSPRLQFRRARGRDSAQVVTPFVQVGTFRHRAGVSVYTAPCAAWHTPVFLLNSRLGRFTATRFCWRSPLAAILARNRASLLPKLRDQYAEFLDHVSLVHLRLLASPTCVGLRYGRFMHCPTQAFLDCRLQKTRAWVAPYACGPVSTEVALASTRFDGQSTQPLLLCSSVPWGVITYTKRGRNLRRLSIGYASGASP
jgi:hypothetical protein